MTRLRLPVLVLTGLVLVGCGSEPVPDQLAAPVVLPSPSASVSTAPAGTNNPDSPTASPASPEAPVQSSELSPSIESSPTAEQVAEVEQFVRDYYAAINRAQHEGDIAGLERLSVPECDCRELPQAIRDTLSLGRIENAAWHLENLRVTNLDADVASVTADIYTADGAVIAPDGSQTLTIDNAGRETLVHALVRDNQRWLLVAVVDA